MLVYPHLPILPARGGRGVVSKHTTQALCISISCAPLRTEHVELVFVCVRVYVLRLRRVVSYRVQSRSDQIPNNILLSGS